MTTKLLIATVAVFAIAPMTAQADPGDEIAQAWLASIKSTKTVAEVRAQTRNLPRWGQKHPVELREFASSRTREEVKDMLEQTARLERIYDRFYHGA